jgi:hypothetical protein
VTLTRMIAYKTTSGESLYLNPNCIAAVVVDDLDEETQVYMAGVAEPHRLPLACARGIIRHVNEHLDRMLPR